MVVVVQVVLASRTTRTARAVAVAVVGRSLGCGYLRRHCSQPRPTLSALVLLALHQAEAVLEVRHYLAHTSRRRAAAAGLEDRLSHQRR